MSLYNTFGTDKNLEVNGVWQDFGTERIKIARTGNKNTAYTKEMRRVSRKLDKIDISSLPEEQTDRIMAEVFVKTIVRDWQVKNKKGEWEQGLTILEKGKEKVVPFNVDNALQCLLDLPDLFNALRAFASELKTFQTEEEENHLQD